MLDILGIIAGSILSLPGILGLALGMTTRKPAVGAGLGVLVGLVSVYVFAGADLARVEMADLAVSPVVGAIAGTLGSLIRRRGATV